MASEVKCKSGNYTYLYESISYRNRNPNLIDECDKEVQHFCLAAAFCLVEVLYLVNHEQ